MSKYDVSTSTSPVSSQPSPPPPIGAPMTEDQFDALQPGAMAVWYDGYDWVVVKGKKQDSLFEGIAVDSSSDTDAAGMWYQVGDPAGIAWSAYVYHYHNTVAVCPYTVTQSSPAPETAGVCSCDMGVLMSKGCACGSIERYEEKW